MNGCDGTSNAGQGRGGKKLDKAIAKRAKEGKNYQDDKARQKEQAKLKNVGKKKSTAFMDVEIPQGHHQEKLPSGHYIIKKD